MPSAAGSAASGAVSGAAAGSAILPGVGTAIGALVGGVGGFLSGSGTQDAQNKANAQAAQQAAMQSAQAFSNYLSSRGISLQQIAAGNPQLETEYNRIRALGDKRDFQTWLFEHLRNTPSDPVWTQINSGTVGAQNTTLPAWAVDANGNPLQPEILKQLLAIQSGANNPATAPIGGVATLANAQAYLSANPDVLAGITSQPDWENAGVSPAQWLVNHITQTESAEGGGSFTTALRNFVTTGANAPGAAGAPGSAGVGNNQTLDPKIAALLPSATTALGGIFDGTYLNQAIAGLKPVQDARTAEAAAQAARIEEQRRLSGNLLDTDLAGLTGVLDARRAGASGIFDATTAGAGGVYGATIAGAAGVRDAGMAAAQAVNDANIAKLADLLGVRLDAAKQIYNASLSAAGGVRDASLTAAGGLRDAQTTGAQNIYGAESLQADTYGQSATQALNRLLAEQTAERARRGFTGGSSGSDITRARLNADYLQRGAGARAQAGVNLQKLLSDAGITFASNTGAANVGYANNTGQAGIGLANNNGRAAELDAQAKLAAAVQLAQQLGLANIGYANTAGNAGVTQAGTLAQAGVTQATSRAQADEQNAIAQLQAKIANATRQLGYLTSDGDIAKANADLKNAQDSLNLLIANQNRVTSSVGAPFSLAGADLSLKGQLNAQQYSGIDALLARLGSFTVGQAGGPALTTSTPGSVLNNSQIAGGVLSGVGSAIGNSSSNSDLQKLINSLMKGGSTAGTNTSDPALVGIFGPAPGG